MHCFQYAIFRICLINALILGGFSGCLRKKSVHHKEASSVKALTTTGTSPLENALEHEIDINSSESLLAAELFQPEGDLSHILSNINQFRYNAELLKITGQSPWNDLSREQKKKVLQFFSQHMSHEKSGFIVKSSHQFTFNESATIFKTRCEKDKPCHVDLSPMHWPVEWEIAPSDEEERKKFGVMELHGRLGGKVSHLLDSYRRIYSNLLPSQNILPLGLQLHITSKKYYPKDEVDALGYIDLFRRINLAWTLTLILNETQTSIGPYNTPLTRERLASLYDQMKRIAWAPTDFMKTSLQKLITSKIGYIALRTDAYDNDSIAGLEVRLIPHELTKDYYDCLLAMLDGIQVAWQNPDKSILPRLVLSNWLEKYKNLPSQDIAKKLWYNDFIIERKFRKNLNWSSTILESAPGMDLASKKFISSQYDRGVFNALALFHDFREDPILIGNTKIIRLLEKSMLERKTVKSDFEVSYEMGKLFLRSGYYDELLESLLIRNPTTEKCKTYSKSLLID